MSYRETFEKFLLGVIQFIILLLILQIIIVLVVDALDIATAESFSLIKLFLDFQFLLILFICSLIIFDLTIIWLWFNFQKNLKDKNLHGYKTSNLIFGLILSNVIFVILGFFFLPSGIITSLALSFSFIRDSKLYLQGKSRFWKSSRIFSPARIYGIANICPVCNNVFKENDNSGERGLVEDYPNGTP